VGETPSDQHYRPYVVFVTRPSSTKFDTSLSRLTKKVLCEYTEDCVACSHVAFEDVACEFIVASRE